VCFQRGLVRQKVVEAAIQPLLTNPPGQGGGVPNLSSGATGITAISPTFPTFPSNSALQTALTDALGGQATTTDWETINQAVQAGILSAANQPGYATVITAAAQWAQQQTAGVAANQPSPLTQALNDALQGVASPPEWATINQAINAGIINPTTMPQYATVIEQARVIERPALGSLVGKRIQLFLDDGGTGFPRHSFGQLSTENR